MVICPNIFMKGNLKVNGNIEFYTDFVGTIQATHHVVLNPGVRIESDIKSGSLRVEKGANLVGNLQIGEARKPLSRLRSWFNKNLTRQPLEKE